MPLSETKPPRPLPKGFIIGGSVFALAHLTAIALMAMAPQSGPWPFYGGETMMEGPQFASAITGNVTFPYYFQPLRLTHNYHFMSNRIPRYGAYFEVRLKNEAGEVIQTLKFPDEKANFWVRHRQSMLAQGLAEDQPVPPSRVTEQIAAPGKEVPKVEIWELVEPGVLKLKMVDEDKVPRNPPAVHPTESSKLLAEAYVRYLCREHKAASGELIRHTRETVTPTDMIISAPRGPDFFNELHSHFGDSSGK